jgi:hypothetical protein
MAEEYSSGTPKENLRASRILCIALITGVLIFTIVSIFVNQFIGPFIEETKVYENIFLWGIAIISSICILITLRQYPKGIAVVKGSGASLNDKLNQYRVVLIKHMAFCEFPALFSIIIFLLIGNFYVFGFTTMMLMIMLAKFPNGKRVISELELNWEEQQQLE